MNDEVVPVAIELPTKGHDSKGSAIAASCPCPKMI